MNIETAIKRTFKFQLDNNMGSFELDEADKQIIFRNEALLVSDSNDSSKKYLIMKKDAFEERWLQSKLENLFKKADSIEDFEEIIKDFAEIFGSDSSEDFINYCRKETNKEFLKFILFKTIFNVGAYGEFIVKKLFNFSSADEDIRSEAASRMLKYFDLNFLEEFTFDYRYVNYQLFVFEVCQWWSIFNQDVIDSGILIEIYGLSISLFERQ